MVGMVKWYNHQMVLSIMELYLLVKYNGYTELITNILGVKYNGYTCCLIHK